MEYKPPFTITSKILSLVAEIAERVGGLSAHNADNTVLRLRRINRIRTIQGSLAIEGNTMTERQITAILDGKRVVAPVREIQEVRNAVKAYDNLLNWNPWDKDDLLDAHKKLTVGLIDSAGYYRRGSVGIMGMGAKEIIHIAPPADNVPPLINDLLLWLQHSSEHPLIVSSVFHYEFEFIHPFEDGNGRLGRLWQTLILSSWKPFFALIPVESIIYKHQQAYYNAINISSQESDSAPFIEFMLSVINEAIKEFEVETGQVTEQVTGQVKKLLLLCNKAMSRRELMEGLNLSSRTNFEKLYLHPALKQKLIERTIPDKPNSRLQKYRLTEQGNIYA